MLVLQKDAKKRKKIDRENDLNMPYDDVARLGWRHYFPLYR